MFNEILQQITSVFSIKSAVFYIFQHFDILLFPCFSNILRYVINSFHKFFHRFCREIFCRNSASIAETGCFLTFYTQIHLFSAKRIGTFQPKNANYKHYKNECRKQNRFLHFVTNFHLKWTLWRMHSVPYRQYFLPDIRSKPGNRSSHHCLRREKGAA